jgi:hypothetical protein
MPSIIDQNATGDTTNIEAGAAAENAVKENASGKKNP